MKRAFPYLSVSLLLCSALLAQDPRSPIGTVSSTVNLNPSTTAIGRTVVVIPFENLSPTPGLEWLGESFPEAFHTQLNSPILYVASRDERLKAYDREGIPAGVHPSRATLYRLAEQMDVDYVLLGSYRFDGSQLTAVAQLLDMRAERLSPAVTESGPLADLGNVQSALAWDLLRLIRTDFSLAKDKYVSGIVPVRLDALENFVRGMLATTSGERLQHYREATRLDPAYSQAWLELGKGYYNERAYEPAIAALSQIQHSSPVASEANFYLGLSAFAHGDFAKAQSAFEFVAARLPLAEAYNDLGVVAARRGQKKAEDYFERAIENDPSDADYHFNLATTLNASGDKASATRELRATIERRPNDAEARSVLESMTSVAGSVVPSSAVSKTPAERLKTNYEEDAFRQMTTQMRSWAEERFARSDPRAHARFHVALGRELMTHGFTTEAEAEFRHAATVDPSSSAPLTALAEDFATRGDSQQARTEAEAALRIRVSAEAYAVLARIDLDENQFDAASEHIHRALQLEPNSSAAQEMKRALAAKLAAKGQR